ncbi:hypothetical protein FBQ82_00730 [Anaerolineae bacterium CFX7]|nr:hypothetical protein [Anaerolineae bacterium CFX7]
MNQNLSWLWTGGVFGAMTLTAFITLQAIVMWWCGNESSRAADGESAFALDKDVSNRRAMYALVAIIGCVAAFLFVKDTEWVLLFVFGIFAVIPYAFLQDKRIEARRRKTRIQVANSLDKMQILAVSRQDDAILDVYAWLEQKLKQDTIFQNVEARLIELIGQGVAVRGNKLDLQHIAREMDSEDLHQFIRRCNVTSKVNDEREIALHAAQDISARIRLDAEIAVAQMNGQMTWFWLAMVVAIGAVAIIHSGAQ